MKGNRGEVLHAFHFALAWCISCTLGLVPGSQQPQTQVQALPVQLGPGASPTQRVDRQRAVLVQSGRKLLHKAPQETPGLLLHPELGDGLHSSTPGETSASARMLPRKTSDHAHKAISYHWVSTALYNTAGTKFSTSPGDVMADGVSVSNFV